MKVLITGGFGFIGHHLVQHIIKNTEFEIVIIDILNYSCKGFERIKDLGYINHPRIQILTYDLMRKFSVGIKREIGKVDVIIHMAAETHVDNSIQDPKFVIKNNVMSTVNILEYARELESLKMFLYFSTDEVYGPAPNDKLYKEWDRHRPTNPYSASKSASEQICISYENTYKIPIAIVNVMNAFGERQHAEKFIPLVINKILNNETVYIHSDQNGTPGSRFYIHARNIAAAVLFLIDKAESGEKYNVTGEKEVTNLEMAEFIAKVMGKPLKYELVDFHSSRPGHDLRYGLDGSKLFEMGWRLPISFEDSLEKTIRWTLENTKWLEM